MSTIPMGDLPRPTLSMQVYCRLQHEHHKPLDVATELNMSLAELRKRAVEGAQEYGHSAESAEQRVARIFEPKVRARR